MLIKDADDHGKRLALLESLQDEPSLNRAQRDWLNSQIWALRMGMSGERNAAHYIDHYYKDSQNLAVIHDLRLEMEDETAQIDHLIISRGLIFYLLETKNFSGNLSINAHGEFTVHYSSGSKGIPSPLEQSKRHEKVLSKWLERLGISGRLGSKPQFFHAVLIDPRGTIQRPAAGTFDSSNVVKADQFDAWRTKHVEKGISIAQTLTAMVNLRDRDTVREWAEKLVRQHRPLTPQQWVPEFMKLPEPSSAVTQAQSSAMVQAKKISEIRPVNQVPERALCASCAKPLSQAEKNFCTDNAKIFGSAMLCMAHQKLHRQVKADAPVPVAGQGAHAAQGNGDAQELNDPRKRKLVCCTCDAKISFEEGKFCWGNQRRFGGLQYCRTHQTAFK